MISGWEWLFKIWHYWVTKCKILLIKALYQTSIWKNGQIKLHLASKCFSSNISRCPIPSDMFKANASTIFKKKLQGTRIKLLFFTKVCCELLKHIMSHWLIQEGGGGQGPPCRQIFSFVASNLKCQYQFPAEFLKLELGPPLRQNPGWANVSSHSPKHESHKHLSWRLTLEVGTLSCC